MQIAPQAATFSDSTFPRMVGTLNLWSDRFWTDEMAGCHLPDYG